MRETRGKEGESVRGGLALFLFRQEAFVRGACGCGSGRMGTGLGASGTYGGNCSGLGRMLGRRGRTAGPPL